MDNRRRIPPGHWRPLLAAVAFGALALGLADPLLRGATLALGYPPPVGSAVSVAIVLPALLCWNAVAYPRLDFCLATLALGLFLFSESAGVAHSIEARSWSSQVLSPPPPGVVIPAYDLGRLREIGGLALLSMPQTVGLLLVATAIAHRYRVVGEPDPLTCAECGYSLIGLTEPRCPECGAPFALQGT